MASGRRAARFYPRTNVQHPTYKALAELGKGDQNHLPVPVTLHDENLRREIHEGLKRDIEQLETAPIDFVFFTRRGETGKQPNRRSRTKHAGACISCRTAWFILTL